MADISTKLALALADKKKRDDAKKSVQLGTQRVSPDDAGGAGAPETKRGVDNASASAGAAGVVTSMAANQLVHGPNATPQMQTAQADTSRHLPSHSAQAALPSSLGPQRPARFWSPSGQMPSAGRGSSPFDTAGRNEREPDSRSRDLASDFGRDPRRPAALASGAGAGAGVEDKSKIDMRKSVFIETLAIAQASLGEADKKRAGDVKVKIEKEKTIAMQRGIKVVNSFKPLSPAKDDLDDDLLVESTTVVLKPPVQVTVDNVDSLTSAGELILNGFNPVVLCMSNGDRPGNNVEEGSNSQEASIFRRTNICMALDPQYNNQIKLVNAGEANSFTTQSNCVYVPGVQVIRSRECYGYQFVVKPYSLNMIAAETPAVDLGNEDDRKTFKEKIRLILRVANKKGHDSVVLGALGCNSTFQYDPATVSELLRQVITEPEFEGVFKVIAFAVEDRTDKTFEPFYNVLHDCTRKKKPVASAAAAGAPRFV